MPVSSWFKGKRKRVCGSPTRGLERTCYVYFIETGDKLYIGFTSRNPEERLEEHLDAAFNTKKRKKFYSALRKHKDITQFYYREYPYERAALVAEMVYIEQNGLRNLWNTSKGGEGATLNLSNR